MKYAPDIRNGELHFFLSFKKILANKTTQFSIIIFEWYTQQEQQQQPISEYVSIEEKKKERKMW